MHGPPPFLVFFVHHCCVFILPFFLGHFSLSYIISAVRQAFASVVIILMDFVNTVGWEMAVISSRVENQSQKLIF